MAYFFLGIALLTILLLFGHGFVGADLKSLARALRWLAAIVGVALVVFMALSGRWSWLPALLVPALPWLMRMRALAAMAKNARGPSAGQASSVETPFLRMVLNHDSGEMDGDVLQGQFAGRKLGALARAEVLALWQECSHDEQSRLVLETYLDRIHGTDWREEAGAPAGSADSHTGMSAQEAREILGLEGDVSAADIDTAYRRLMLKMHPDHGGSDWMAAKINRAREVLLAQT